MRTSLYEKLWLAASLAFIAYPIGDLLNFWDIQAAVVLLCACILLLAGRNVGEKRQGEVS